MKPAIKRLWITALLSGKYKQGKSCLKKGNKFCCLGVLSDLYAKKHNIEWKKEKYENVKLFNESELLPSKVMQWAALSRKNPMVKLTDEAKKKMGYDEDDGNIKEDLTTLNDDVGCNFKVISECIKTSL